MHEASDTRLPLVREVLEQRERDTLSPHAALAAASRGRERPEQEHPHRTAFQRDRDRILHTKAFRRLKRKTQVFLAPEGDHYRTRLTHTLEVAQIARTVARALFLNEDLVEAIALGHDLGHAPFGHAGEAVLNDLFEPGFDHAVHSVRIVDKLESTRHGQGLNLTAEVREGIRDHSRGKCILLGESCEDLTTREAEIVSVCDAIAYINHDIDDAIRSGLLTLEDLPRHAVGVLGRTPSERINTMACALVIGSQNGAIGMEEEVRAATVGLRAYLYREVYPCDAIGREIAKANKIIREIYEHLLAHPMIENQAGDAEESIERRTVDFIAGMSDQYALQYYARLFFPAPWPS